MQACPLKQKIILCIILVFNFSFSVGQTLSNNTILKLLERLHICWIHLLLYYCNLNPDYGIYRKLAISLLGENRPIILYHSALH